MNIGDLTGEYLRLLEMAEDETIDPQTLQDTAESITAEIEEKADAYAAIITQMKANAELLTKESERLKERAEAYKNKADGLKAKLEWAMRTINKPKFKTLKHTYWLQKNTPSLELDEVDLTTLPDKFVRVKKEADKTAIKEALQKGETLPYARLKQSESLRVR